MLLGSTAINDELQDDLEETLDFFIKTGIKVWVLTGDKFDTAKSIAFSSKLITHYFKLFEFQNILNEFSLKNKIDDSLLEFCEFQKNKENFYKSISAKAGKNGNLIATEKTFANSNNNNMINVNFRNEQEVFCTLNLVRNKDLSNKLIEEQDVAEEVRKYEQTKFAIIIGSDELELIMKNPALEENV